MCRREEKQEQNGRSFKVGEVYLMDFGGSGSEQSGLRPGLVFQNNKGNAHSPNIIALPLTTSIKKLGQPTHVLVSARDTGLLRDSIILCENPERMSKDKVGKFLTKLPEEYMRKVAVATLISFGVMSLLDPEIMIKVWRETYILNATPVA